MTLDDPWLAAAWRFVGRHVPAPPAVVVEIGCGPLGGFVPELIELGYDAVGVDPNAPDESAYRRVTFEDADLPRPVHAVIASASLHHVSDLDQIVDRIEAMLDPGGRLVVVEWAWERFDEATARWCFARLSQTAEPSEHGWLGRHQERWLASKQPWDAYVAAWAAEEHLHRAERIIAVLDARFERLSLEQGPYLFGTLEDTSEADEQAAIDAGDIEALAVRYVATRR